MDKHLWEYDHPYYCSEGHYAEEFSSWEAFLDEMGDSDMDLNLLFRWDWIHDDEDGAENDTLFLFFMQQRKGKFVVIRVAMQDTDEDSVKTFLQARWAHLTELWMPFGGGNDGS